MTTQLLESPTGIISLFNTTKAERKSFTDAVMASIDEGRAEPLALHVQVKCMEDIIKNITSDERYKSAVLDAAEKHGKGFQLHNASFQVKEAGTKYDWSTTGDKRMAQMIEAQDAAAAALKAHQEMLKAMPADGLEVIDDETGEAYRIYPPAKSSTTTVAVTLK